MKAQCLLYHLYRACEERSDWSESDSSIQPLLSSDWSESDSSIQPLPCPMSAGRWRVTRERWEIGMWRKQVR